MHVPVLTYHAVNIDGNAYANNDHVAFAADLRAIDDLGYRVVPLDWVSDGVHGCGEHDLSRAVALTCDDGSDFDFHDLDHPTHGRQRSLFNCMRDFIDERGPDKQPHLHLTSFVIASAQARTQLDQRCLIGRNWIGEHWWQQAIDSGRMTIGCHSWEHNHAALGVTAADGTPRGSFDVINTRARAEHEIAQAMTYLQQRLPNENISQFAFPFGQSNHFLLDDYLPTRGHELGLRAAWSTDGRAVTTTDNIWNLPRYVCGWHWKSPEQLHAILAAT